MVSTSSESRQLLRNLLSIDETVREAAMNQVRALSPEEQLQLMDYAGQEEERSPTSVFRRLYAHIMSAGFLSSEHIFQQACRPTVISAIVDDVTDPRFIAPLLNMLITLSKMNGKEDTDGRPSWGSPVILPQATIHIQIAGLYERYILPLRIQVLHALKRTLANVQAHDVLSLTLEQKDALLIPLNAPYRDVELTLLVLNVLKQIGEEEPIPLLERIARIEAVTDNMKRVRQATLECLDYLRAKHSRQAKTLLRASGPATSAELLRPAAEQNDPTPPAELLRSSVPKIM
jgi:hypothetical protein